MMLVIDVGTTGLRASILDPEGGVNHVEYRPFAPSSPSPGMVEFDPAEMAELVIGAATTSLAAAGNPTVAGVGIAVQRGSTVMWERSTGRPVGPALGWQDLRTVGECLTAKSEHGLSLAPNQTATKVQWLLANAANGRDPAELCVGTIDAWIAWTLSRGDVHVTDHTNAAVTGIYSLDQGAWNEHTCDLLRIDPSMLPTLVDSGGILGVASALPGAPPLAALVGDQQASLVGQGCIRPGMAKITFGTGAMLDVCTGTDRTGQTGRSEHGTFPIVAWSIDGTRHFGDEAIMLSAGTNIEWLVRDMALIDSPADSHIVASQVSSSEGAVYVPALLGLGTPNWDYGARGLLLGLTRGTKRAHVVRAVLEGIAHRAADMVAAAEADTELEIPALRVDGGMSRNPTFVQALADATAKPVEVAPVLEATTLGAGFLAGVAAGVWSSLEGAAGTRSPSRTVEPAGELDRDRWAEAVRRTEAWIPELSALDF